MPITQHRSNATINNKGENAKQAGGREQPAKAGAEAGETRQTAIEPMGEMCYGRAQNNKMAWRRAAKCTRHGTQTARNATQSIASEFKVQFLRFADLSKLCHV